MSPARAPAAPRLTYTANRAGAGEIAAHLRRCDGCFVPPLSSRVSLEAYAAKIEAHAERFEAWDNGELAGLVAAYCNDPARLAAFVTSVSVVPERRGEGVAGRLMRDCIERARLRGFALLRLTVAREQSHAIRLYERCGFAALPAQPQASDIRMILELKEACHARL